MHDIFKISGDHYEGTEFDLTKGPGAGPWGDPLANYRIARRQRPIGIPLTCYVHIGQVKSWLPDPIKGVSWFGYGAVDSTYITPLWPFMEKLPEFYHTGSRYEDFRRDSGWWICSYVQEMTRLHYDLAIQDLYAFRDPKLNAVYDLVPTVQDLAASVYQTDPELARDIIQDFAFNTAQGWFAEWKNLGDMLLGKYAFERVKYKSGYPDWWVEFLETAN